MAMAESRTSESEDRNGSSCQETALQAIDGSATPGVAAIKPQYLVKRSRSEITEGGAVNDQDTHLPPTKKKRRGQNKHRPRSRVMYSEQLCSSLRLHGGPKEKCPFGENCRYMHDIEKYMASKPEDLGDKCFLFETYGKCLYGLACRFGGSHLNARFENVVNEAVFDPNRPETTANILSKGLQEQLRKRTLKFPRSDAYLVQLTQQKGREGVGSFCRSPSAKVEIPSDKGHLVLSRSSSSVQSFTESVANSGNDMPSYTENVTNPNSSMPSFTENVLDPGSSEQSFTESVANADSSVRSCIEESEAKKSPDMLIKTCGAVTDEDFIRLQLSEKRKVDFRDKLFLAPLTTVGNLPFRRVCKEFGADITCGEMAMCTNLLQGQQSEWALLKRHESEDVFGVQVCGSHADTMTRCAELLNTKASVDFVDINTGCPIDLVFKKGAGCALMGRHTRFEGIVRGMTDILDCPLTVKMRTGIYNSNWNAHKLIPKLKAWGVSMVTLHGRSREQRYTKMADWEYINMCAKEADPMPLFGNGDILSFEDYYSHRRETAVAGSMIARMESGNEMDVWLFCFLLFRGALIKPWIFTEIKEKRHWDISSSERMEILHRYANYGLEHWGSDTQGVENTRRFLLEWLSFLYRYIPIGLLERVPQRINERPPSYEGRDELETLMSSNNCHNWIKISEMLLGPIPQNFTFLPKHKANAYS